MKRICLFVAAALLSTAGIAQEKPVFGLKAGLNVATLNIASSTSNDSRIGLHAGVLAHIHLTPQWGLQPEIVYSAQGMKTSTTNTTRKLDYINVPIMVQYMFDNGFRAQAGPQIGFLVDAEDELNDGREIELPNTFKTVDAGLGFGFGYLSYTGIGIDARYNLGLSNIREVGSETKNRVLQIGIFYMFDTRHKAKSR
jgi:hypothetical protein